MYNDNAVFERLAPARMMVDSSRVLVVEDDRISRMMLVEILRSHGFSHIKEARDGEEALACTLEWKPDFVILDIRMPKMDGYAYCREIRRHPDFRHLPILVQTGILEGHEKTAIFAAGASDYVAKPVDPHELAARTFVHLERKALLQDLHEYKERLTRELDLARRMQMVLVPDDTYAQNTGSLYNLEIRQLFRPCSELGGDLWGLRPVDDNRIALFMTDFTGHGIDAALNTFRLHTLMHNMPEHLFGEPAAYLNAISRILKELLPVHQFATMFYGVLDIKQGELSYASAASTSPMLTRASGSREILGNSSLPLGIDDSVRYQQHVVPFGKGDSLLLFSDALVETPHHQTGEHYDEQELHQRFSEVLRDRGLHGAHEQLVKHFDRHYATNCNDDLTICAYRWQG